MGTFATFVQKIFNLAGLQVSRLGSTVSRQHRIEAVAEIDALCRQFIFPDLSSNPDRCRLLANLEGTHTTEAMYVIASLQRSINLPGDICEFGVAQGATSALMANEIRQTEKTLWLFDSFEGLPQPTNKDVLIDDIFNLGDINRYVGKMAHGPGEVLRRLRSIGFPLNRVQLVPGFIEKTIHNSGLPKQISFSYIDFDFYEPILIALRFLHERMPATGYIVVDDFGYFSSGVKTAVDEFMTEHPAQYELSLPLPLAGHFAILKKLV